MNRIIQTLKENPGKNVAQVAYMLSLPTIEVTQAQKKYLRPFIPCDSPLWGKPGESVSAFRYDPNNMKG